MHKYT
ncbi:hypothetical protein VCPCS023_001536A, partial [Vibrio cholerae O1 str. PCS-023]